MTKKRKTGLAIGAAAACIAVLCAAGACNESAKEKKTVNRVIVTTPTTAVTSQPTEGTTTATPTTTAPMTTTVGTTTEPQITTTDLCGYGNYHSNDRTVYNFGHHCSAHHHNSCDYDGSCSG